MGRATHGIGPIEWRKGCEIAVTQRFIYVYFSFFNAPPDIILFRLSMPRLCVNHALCGTGTSVPHRPSREDYSCFYGWITLVRRPAGVAAVSIPRVSIADAYRRSSDDSAYCTLAFVSFDQATKMVTLKDGTDTTFQYHYDYVMSVWDR